MTFMEALNQRIFETLYAFLGKSFMPVMPSRQNGH
jgi:hypothetical protein